MYNENLFTRKRVARVPKCFSQIPPHISASRLKSTYFPVSLLCTASSCWSKSAVMFSRLAPCPAWELVFATLLGLQTIFFFMFSKMSSNVDAKFFGKKKASLKGYRKVFSGMRKQNRIILERSKSWGGYGNNRGIREVDLTISTYKRISGWLTSMDN